MGTVSAASVCVAAVCADKYFQPQKNQNQRLDVLQTDTKMRMQRRVKGNLQPTTASNCAAVAGAHSCTFCKSTDDLCGDYGVT